MFSGHLVTVMTVATDPAPSLAERSTRRRDTLPAPQSEGHRHLPVTTDLHHTKSTRNLKLWKKWVSPYKLFSPHYYTKIAIYCIYLPK